MIDHKIIANEREQLPIIINKQNEIIAVGTLFIKENYKQAMKIKIREMNLEMHDDLKEVLLTEEDIQSICKDLGSNLRKIIKVNHLFVLVS